MGEWEKKKIGKLNQYKSITMDPLNCPNEMFELYSVPSWDNQYPEILSGSSIGSTKQIVQKDDVLVCKINPRINRVWVVSQFTEHRTIASSEWIVIRNDKIDSNYLMKYFESPQFRDLLVLEQAGIGGSLTRAQPKRVKEYTVPIPNVVTQTSIAQTLQQMNSVINLRKSQIEKLDLLINSQFIHMFGDPVSNLHGWPIVKLPEVYDKIDAIKCGPFGSALKKDEYKATGIPVWTMENIAPNNTFVNTHKLFITQSKYSTLNAYNVQNKDIIISRAGTVGKMAVVNTHYNDSIISTNLIRLRLDNTRILSIFFVRLLGVWGNKVCRLKTGNDGAFTHMNTGVLNSIEFPLPPIEEQNQFADFVQQVEQQKALLQQSLAKMEENYKSLMQKCFRGEIFS